MNHVLRPGTKRPIGYNRENDVRLLERFLSRRNTSRSAAKMSRRLIEHFGDIASAIRAEPAELAPLAGPQIDLAGDFRHLRELLESIARSDISDRPLLDDLESVQRYCQVLLGGERREQLHVLFLDRAYRLLAQERMQSGTVDHVAVYPREILARAVVHMACGLIVVHNHPSGNTMPSKGDLYMTSALVQASQSVEICVHDHIIFGRGAIFSFRHRGLLAD